MWIYYYRDGMGQYLYSDTTLNSNVDLLLPKRQYESTRQFCSLNSNVDLLLPFRRSIHRDQPPPSKFQCGSIITGFVTLGAKILEPLNSNVDLLLPPMTLALDQKYLL